MSITITNNKYQIHNQLTGMTEETTTFAEMCIVQERIKLEYFASLTDLFTITILVENENGSWTQSACDENGEVIIPLWETLSGKIPVTIIGDVPSSESSK